MNDFYQLNSIPVSSNRASPLPEALEIYPELGVTSYLNFKSSATSISAGIIPS